jgi:hypothetical protein
MSFEGEHVEIDRPSQLVDAESMVGEDGAPTSRQR